MSNVVTNNPLILDTAADDVITDTIKITKIRWVGSTAVDHEAQLEDGNERVIWRDTNIDIGTANNTLVIRSDSDFVPPLLCKGLSVGTLGSGILYVYYDGPTPLKV